MTPPDTPTKPLPNISVLTAHLWQQMSPTPRSWPLPVTTVFIATLSVCRSLCKRWQRKRSRVLSWQIFNTFSPIFIETKIEKKQTFMWIPRHTGIQGNEPADMSTFDVCSSLRSVFCLLFTLDIENLLIFFSNQCNPVHVSSRS